MPDLNYSFHLFLEQVNNEAPLVLSRSGKWKPLSRWFSKLLKWAKLDPWIWVSVEHNFCHFLDQYENVPVRFPSEGTLHQEILAASFKLLDILPHAKLKQKAIALQYRLESINGGKNRELASSEDFLWLREEAGAWKAKQKIFWSSALTAFDLKVLGEAAKYGDFLKMIEEDPKLKEKFFQWTLRDHIYPDVFIEYPSLAESICYHLLNGRIGTLGSEKLKIEKRASKNGNYSYKIVTLPFEGRALSLLDMNEKVVFRGGYTLTIKEIFELFRLKPRKFVDVEYFAQGISNWNAQHLGYYVPSKETYNTIDLDQNEWWRQLPPLEIISTEEAQARYGTWVNGVNWIVAAKAAREHLNLNYERCHAYLEMAIPSPDGNYYIYEFGKFARFFPYGVVDNMKIFSVTVPATVAYPDENLYHTARQQVGYSFEMNHYQGLILLEELRQDILQARNGNMIFQVEAENCAHWIQTHLEDLFGKQNVPNLFRAQLLKSDAKGVIGAYFKFVRLFPPSYHRHILALIHYPFGPWKGQYVVDKTGQKVFKSLYTTSFWQDIIVYMPALLHYHQEKGSLSFEDDHVKEDMAHNFIKKD